MTKRQTLVRAGIALLLAGLPALASERTPVAPDRARATEARAREVRAARARAPQGERATAGPAIRTLRPAGSDSTAVRVRPDGAGTLAAAASGPMCRAPEARPERPTSRVRAQASAARSPVTEGTGPLAPVDLSASELLPSSRLTKIRPSDDRGAVVGLTDGRLVVLGLEETRLYAVRSANGGTSFSPEQTIAGSSTQKPVLEFSAAMSSSGTIVVAAVVVDSVGQHGLQVIRSTDAGTTWIVQDVITPSSYAHGVAAPVVALGPGQLWAIAFMGERQAYPYLVISTNNASSWSILRQLDPSAPSTALAPEGLDVAIDSAGVIYAAFAQDYGDGSGAHVYVTRVRNNGVTQDAEVDVLPTAEAAGPPDVAVATEAGGGQNVLVAFYDAYNINLVTSLDDGVTFSPVLPADQRTLTGDLLLPPRIFTGAAGQTVLVLFPQGIYGWMTGSVDVYRSTNAGVSFAWTGPDGRPEAEVSLFAYPRYEALRLSSGTWVMAWSDGFADWFGFVPDIYAKESTDDGLTWSVVLVDVDAEPDGTNDVQGLFGLAPGASGGAFAAFGDGRNDRSASLDTWGTSLTLGAGGLTAGTPRRLDAANETATLNPRNYDAPAAAVDRDGMVYVAYSAVQPGPLGDLFVARSYDGGYTFEAPVRVGNTSPATALDLEPTIAASSQGYVYVGYQTEDSDPNHIFRYIRVNSSKDYGRTFRATDIELNPGASGLPLLLYDNPIDHPNIQIAPGAGATVFVLYSDYFDLFLHKSTDGGATFNRITNLAAGSGLSVVPRICSVGNRVIVVHAGIGSTFGVTLFAQVSNDGGATWGARVDLAAVPLQSIDGQVFPISLACDTNGNAVVAWSEDLFPLTFDVKTARFNGTTWGAPVSVPTPPNEPDPAASATYLPSAAFSSVNNLVLSYSAIDTGAVYAVRSSDGGATYAAGPTILTEAAGYGVVPQLSSDGQSRVFVHWLDYIEEPFGAVLMRRSADNGATWGSAYRMDRRTPAGAYGIDYGLFNTSGAQSDMGHVAFLAWRSGRGYETVVQSLDADDLPRTRTPIPGDSDENHVVDGFDLGRLGRAFGAACQESRYQRRTDVDHSCLVDGADLTGFATNFGRSN